MPRVSHVFVGILLGIVALLPLNSPGTVDVPTWLRWIEAIERDGLVAGFANTNADYPPLCWVVLRVVVSVSHALGIDMFLALKWSLVVFLAMTSLALFVWTRNLLLTAGLHLSLVLNSMALGYLDIYFAPTLILALWALKERRYFWFSTCFTISCLTKWQPLILAPFFLAHLLGRSGVSKSGSPLQSLLRDVVLPAAVLVGAMIWQFGEAFFASFGNALSHPYLSGNALNYNWLLTHYLHVTQPERFGPLADGIAEYVYASDWPTVGFSKIMFGLFYAVTLVVFFRRPQSYDNILRFAIAGYLAYFTFNTGVHENHLFLAGILGIVLYWENGHDLYAMLILNLMANINLFLFYGVNGTAFFPRLIGVDVALPLALFNVIFFLVFWVTTCRRKKK